MSPAAAASPSASQPLLPGTTGTPAAAAVTLARILSPITSIASADGPMKTRPAAAQARAKSGFPDRNPQPGCTAWAPARAAAARLASLHRVDDAAGRGPLRTAA